MEIAEKPEDSRIVVRSGQRLGHDRERDAGRSPQQRGFLPDREAPDHPVRVDRDAGSAKASEFEIDGNLTIKDITNPVTFKAEFLGWGPGMGDATLAAFTAKTTIERADWDLTWNMSVETGGLLVGKKVDLEIDAEILKAE